MMKKIILPVIILGCFYSCNKDPQPLTKEEMKHKIDSLIKVRILQSDEQARRDLDDRMRIEVKVKVDSIVNAKLQQGKIDTVKKPKINVPPGPPFMPAIKKSGNI